MTEKIQITIENLDDMNKVLTSLDLLFQKLIMYHAIKDLKKLYTLVVSCSVYFGQVLRIIGYKEDDFKK